MRGNLQTDEPYNATFKRQKAITLVTGEQLSNFLLTPEQKVGRLYGPSLPRLFSTATFILTPFI